MKNGYYLSAYISIDKIGNLYKLISNRHDMAIALWKFDGINLSLVRYWELERLSRIKHHDVPFFDEKSAKGAIDSLLAEENLSLGDIIEIWGCPKLGDKSVCEDGDFYFHSISHLFSSILIDTDIFYNNKILSFALDLKSDNETEERKPEGYGEYIGCYSNKGEVTFFNISSPAIIWSICKNELGLQEGSLMALATATNCLLKKHADVSATVGFEYPNYALGYEVFQKVFGSLTPDDVINIDPTFSIRENLISAGMKEVNRITTEMMEWQVEKFLNQFSLNPEDTFLSISGGFGLNCPTNSHLLRKYHFKGFMGPPCMDDSGEALGIGLYKFYKNASRFNFKLQHAYYGKSYFDDKQDLDTFMECGLIKSISSLSPETFVNDLERDIIVWFDSCAEIGPRALGHRSILGDPRKSETKDRLNHVKQRQFWRPVAPIILKEYLSDWFEDDFDSPYMLHTSHVKRNKAEQIPAVLHYDGTARIQTITNHPENKVLYDLIKVLFEKTGVPIVCNTSLNDKGEPIINTPKDAIRFAITKNIRIVYINGKRFEVNTKIKYPATDFFVPELNMLFTKDVNQLLINEENPYGLNTNELLWRNTFKYDIKTEKGAKSLRRAAEYVYRTRPDMKRLFDLELN